MKLVEICDELVSASRRKIPFGVNCEIRIITFVSIKGRDPRSGVWSIIISELS